METRLIEIDVTPAELQQGKLGEEHHRKAVRALREDGIVVLNNIVSQASIDGLRERVTEDVERLLARDVLVNDVVISVTKAILGNGLTCGFYSGNTALQSDARQPVHADEGQLWPDLETAPPAHALVVNVPLVDMNAENGSTEMWPGTHLDTSVTISEGTIEVSEEALAARRKVCPPVQPTVKAGSVVIRDMRMWHAGMPNRTPNPRPMIAMIHGVSWKPGGRVRFARGSEPFLEHPDLRWQVELTDDAIDHIKTPGGFMAPTA